MAKVPVAKLSAVLENFKGDKEREELRMELLEMCDIKILLSDNKAYLAPGDGIKAYTDVWIEIDDLKFLKLPDEEERKIRSYCTGRLIIPEEHKGKYCAIYGGNVLFSSRSEEEVRKYIKDNPNIELSRYQPPSAAICTRS